MPTRAKSATQLWSKKAEKQFNLKLLADEEHAASRQASWKAYVKDREKAEAAQRWVAAHGDTLQSGAAITDVVPQGVAAVLAAAPNLTDEDCATLQACPVVVQTEYFDDGYEEMHSSTYTTRLYSPASTTAVDLRLSDYYKLRYSRGCVEYATIVQYTLVDAAVDSHWDPEWDSSFRLVGHFVANTWKGIYSLTPNDDDPRLGPYDMEGMGGYPEPKLLLTLEDLKTIRQHVFGGGAAAALSDRLSDCELVQLLVVSSGAQWNEFRGGKDKDEGWERLSPRGWEISKDGWLEHHAREMCNELRPEDAGWKPKRDIEKEVLAGILSWANRKRSPSVYNEIKKRIEAGRFTKEAFKEDGAPEGYFDADYSD